jgi:hypothetical protein
LLRSIGGETGIRTLGTITCTTVFETVPFNHSGISPGVVKEPLIWLGGGEKQAKGWLKSRKRVIGYPFRSAREDGIFYP